jgi:hypothetical protein
MMTELPAGPYQNHVSIPGIGEKYFPALNLPGRLWGLCSFLLKGDTFPGTEAAGA